MKAMWPVRIEEAVKSAFEQAAAEQRVDVSYLRRLAYDEYIANHPDFFNPAACERTQSAIIQRQEVA